MKIFFLLFEADEIAIDIKYVASMEAPEILKLKNNEKKRIFLGLADILCDNSVPVCSL